MNVRLLFCLLLLLVSARAESLPDHDHETDQRPESGPSAIPDPAEKIHELQVHYHIQRDGSVSFEQRFRLGVAGVAIQRGPILNYLTVFRGPAGLMLDTGLSILEVTREGRAESFHLDRKDGFVRLYIGEADTLLSPGIHEYRIRGQMGADWQKREGEFAAAIDLVGSLPSLPIGSVVAVIELPEGVSFSNITAAVTGAGAEAERRGPAYESREVDNRLTVRTTAPLGVDRQFFVNFTWPSASFAMQSHWAEVIRQHPRIPLTVLAMMALLCAVLVFIRRQRRRPAPAR